MQIFSWMTWALSLALAVGGVLNISQALDLQTEVMTWQAKYVVIINAAWPLYVAFLLALIAGIGATIEVYINTMPSTSMSRMTSATTQTRSQPAAAKPARVATATAAAAAVTAAQAEEDSFVQDFERVSQSTPHQMVNLYDAVQAGDANTMAVSQTMPVQDRTPQRFSNNAPTKKDDDDLEFFRMG